jgi:hypothetical protein
MDSELMKTIFLQKKSMIMGSANYLLKAILYHTYSKQSILKILIQRLTIIFILRGMNPTFTLISLTKNEQHHDNI